MSAKHTPGPWIISPIVNGWYAIRPSDSEIVGTIAEVMRRTDAETHANARLIAAAPELIEIALKLRAFIGRSEVGNAYLSRAYVDEETQLREQLTAAIAKATGGEQ